VNSKNTLKFDSQTSIHSHLADVIPPPCTSSSSAGSVGKH